MTDYRTPLPAMLAALVESGLNQAIGMDPTGQERLRRLDGRLLAVVLDGLGITLYLGFEYGAVNVGLDAERDPDTTVTGTPSALFSMAGGERWGLPGSGVTIAGDAGLARDLGEFFRQLDINWEAPLASFLGDTLGFQIASGLRRGSAAARQAASGAAEQAGHYLREESGLVVDRAALGEFTDAVDDLRDGVGRLSARLRRMEQAT
ncbi:hypothetical protein F3N42_10870 [Marinihelvus fidelis]|uniref:Ubiquinone biosynthesis accessory factor UbiJ n=1 Tax=Marinihelvus fidelis TaxID=2613842 RepID=A0A5N0T806_9GAMM|nr:SCP2 sterol-binding domain-containing protein [Marinihelvus fidelis]KAA9130858.1 hypothetical protein F3N42_10870 [Marinihelvus fidelis]